MGDDRIGWQVVEELGQRSDLPANVDVVALPHPMALAALLQEANRALIIDAVVTGGTPGQLHEFDLKKVPPPARMLSSSHGTDLAEVITLAGQVGRLPRELRLLGIEIVPGGSEAHSQLAAALSLAVTWSGRWLMQAHGTR